MKKRIFLGVLCALLALLMCCLAGCIDDDKPGTVPDVSAPTLSLACEEAQGTLTASAPANGTAYAVGESVTITLSPAPGYAPDSAVFNGESVAIGEDHTVTVTLAKGENVFIAAFRRLPDGEVSASLSLTVNNAQFGTLTASAPANGTAYAVGESVTITLSPAPGYAPDSAVFNGESVAIGEGLTVTVTLAKGENAFTAAFRRLPDGEVSASLSLTVNNAQFGALTAAPAPGDNGYLVGQRITLAPAPAPYCRLVSLTFNGEALTVGADGTVTVTLEKENTAQAVFAAEPMPASVFASLCGVMKFGGSYTYEVQDHADYNSAMYLQTVYADGYIWQKEWDMDTGEVYYDAVFKDQQRRLAEVRHTLQNTIAYNLSTALFEKYYNPFDLLTAADFVRTGEYTYRLLDADKAKAAASALSGYNESIETFTVTVDASGAAVRVSFRTVLIHRGEIDYVSTYDLAISERGTAAVPAERINPYPHEESHDALKRAMEAAAAEASYTIRHRGHEVGYVPPEGGETRPGYGDTDYRVYVSADMVFDAYKGEEHGFKLLNGYAYPFDIVAGKVVLRDPVAEGSIAAFLSDFTGFVPELFTCIGNGVYVLHDNATAPYIAPLFAVGNEKAVYGYATDFRITLQDGVLSEVFFTYKTYGIEEEVTLNYTFGPLPEEADLDFENATKTSVLDPFKGNYEDGEGHFCGVDRAGFVLNGKDVTIVSYDSESATFLGLWEGQYIYIQKLTSVQIMIYTEDGSIHWTLTSVVDEDITVPKNYRGTWEYHDDTYDDVFRIQTHAVFFRENGGAEVALRLLSFNETEGLTAEHGGKTFNFVLREDGLILVTLVHEDLSMEPFTVTRTSASAGVEIPADYIGYYISENGATKIIITYEGITVNGTPYIITAYSASEGFTGTLGAVSGYTIQFYSMGGSVNKDRLMAGTLSDNVLLDRKTALNEDYIGSWESTDGETTVRITETEIFLNGVSIDFTFDPEYGYAFERPGSPYTTYLLRGVNVYGNVFLAMYDDDGLLINLFPVEEPTVPENYLGVFTGTGKDGVAWRLTVAADGTVTLTIGDGETITGTDFLLADDGAFFAFTAGENDYTVIDMYDGTLIIFRDSDPDDEGITLARASDVIIPDSYRGVWQSAAKGDLAAGYCTLTVTEDGVTLTLNGEEQEVSGLAVDDEGMTFTLADGTECFFASPASYGGSAAPFSLGSTWFTLSAAA